MLGMINAVGVHMSPEDGFVCPGGCWSFETAGIEHIAEYDRSGPGEEIVPGCFVRYIDFMNFRGVAVVVVIFKNGFPLQLIAHHSAAENINSGSSGSSSIVVFDLALPSVDFDPGFPVIDGNVIANIILSCLPITVELPRDGCGFVQFSFPFFKTFFIMPIYLHDRARNLNASGECSGRVYAEILP